MATAVLRLTKMWPLVRFSAVCGWYFNFVVISDYG